MHTGPARFLFTIPRFTNPANPHFSLCRFKVMDDERISDDLAAWACFRLDRLQPGLRMLHLYDANGVITKGVMLVRIRKVVS
jgi:hypothetical protein